MSSVSNFGRRDTPSADNQMNAAANGAQNEAGGILLEECRIDTRNLPKKLNLIDNLEEYQRLTKARDWAGIFKQNNTEIYSFGTKKELNVLGDYLEDDEIVFALVSGVMSQTDTSNSFDSGANTWIAALTNERILLLDHAMLSSSVDTQSIRHDRIQAVSASQGWVLGKVLIDIGNRSIVIDNCHKAHVPVFASLANKLLKEIQTEIKPTTSVDDSPVAQLERLASLKTAGILDDEEFATAKAKILAKM